MNSRTIAVIGSGVAGWSLACVLGRVFTSPEVKIIFLDNEQVDFFAAEYAASYIHDFNDMLGISLRDLIAETNSTLSYGTRFKNWAFSNQDFLMAESVFARDENGINFPQFFAAAKKAGLAKNFDDFILPAVAAKLGRFGFPIKNKSSIYSNLQFGINLDLQGYIRLMAKIALNIGVVHVKGRVATIDEIDNTGNVKTLVLEDGQKCSADLYIDCSHDGDLARKILAFPEGYHSNAPELPRLTIGSMAPDAEFKPLVDWLGVEGGVAQIIPLRHKKIIALHTTEEINVLSEPVLHGVTINSPCHVTSKKGNHCINKPWVANAVAMGPAAFCQPITPWGEFKWFRNQVVRFVELFMGFDVLEYCAGEYNRLCIEEHAMVKELSALTYFIGSANNKSFAEFFDNYPLLHEVRHRLQLYSNAARHTSINCQVVSSDQLDIFFLGSNILPEWTEVRVDKNPENQLLKYCQHLYSLSQSAALNLPLYAECMHQYLLQKNK